jgi:hypothetical protein
MCRLHILSRTDMIKNILQIFSIAHKTKDRVTRTPLKTGVNSDDTEGLAVPAPLVVPVVLI